MAINLDPILKLPILQKIAILCVFIVLLSVVFYTNLYSPKREELKNLTLRLEDAKKKLDESKGVTKELERFKKEVAELNIALQKVLTQLPNEKEIPALLTAISNAGKESGLDFLLFKPNNEVPRGFYAEVPVSIEVTGGYHNLAVFLEKIRNMPRIVNITNLSMGGAKDMDGKIILKSQFLATTFRFLPQEAKGEKKAKK